MSQRQPRPPAWSYAAVVVALAIFVALIGRCLGPLAANPTPTPTLMAAPVVTRTPIPVVTPVPAVSTVRTTATLTPPTPTVVAPSLGATIVPSMTVAAIVTMQPSPAAPKPAPYQLPDRRS